MNFAETYQQKVTTGEIQEDVSQRNLLPHFQRIFDELMEKRRWWRSWLGRQTAVKGLYFYGGVGIGKTFLMDLFYHAYPFEDKLRLHFHEFMANVQTQLTALQGTENPLTQVAKDLAKTTRLLCLDECVVNDIGDAMILGRLLTALFQNGITLITTSNVAPDGLYEKGLHRQRFLPAIELIKSQCEVVPVLSTVDYRKGLLERTGLYISPLTKESDDLLETLFRSFVAPAERLMSASFALRGREVTARKRASRVVWFDFNVLCATPRSQLDYLSLADKHQVVVLSNVPVITMQDINAITYFILLVDVLYDKGRLLILSAETDKPGLYPAGPKAFEYQRTISRLFEMGSKPYLDAALACEDGGEGET